MSAKTRAASIFSTLGEPDAEAATEILAACPLLTLGSGTEWDSTEFRDAALLVVERGVVVIRADIPDRDRGVIVCHAGAGLIILPPEQGETLRVLDEATLEVVSGAARDRLLELPTAGQLILDALAETLRQKTRTIAILSSFHHVDRLRAKFRQLAGDFGRVGRHGIRLEVPLTHDLLAEMIGSARETVTRALEELQREGFLVRNGREYTLRLGPDEIAPPV